MLEVRLLGQFDLQIDGQTIEIPSHTAQSLLAYLILHKGTAFRREKLAGMLWPDTDEVSARGNLRNTLWKLRKAIGEAYIRADKTSIAFNTDEQYRLDLAKLDARPTDAITTTDLIQVVSEYKGELLPGFYEDWVVLERERLQTVFERRMQRLLDRLVDERRLEEIIEWGEHWIAFGLSPEPAYRAIMMAHSALGDLSSMTSVYQRCVVALKEDLDVEPSEDTQTLFDRLSQGEKPLAAPEKRPRHNLPVQLTSFVGRKKELSEIITHLQDPSCRLLTLIGPGGSGKTRLAIQAATECLEAFPDRVLYVDLTTLTTADMVPQAVASVIGVYSEAELSIEDALENALFARNILLIMDNCEHVLDGAAQLISFLLHRCPGLSVFTTSREPLGIGGELIYMVPVMSLPGFDESLDSLVEKDATVLFQERAIAANPQFKLSENNSEAVVHICRRVDGIPLAIELAAARTRAFSPQEISDRIEDRFQFLISGSRDAPSRQQTFQSSVDWSYELLNEEEKVVFNRLSVFRGGFSLEGAEHICSGNNIKTSDVIEILSQLIDKSLVKPPQTSDGQTLYDLLETLRQYGSEQLEKSGKSYSIQQQHAEYYITLAEEAEMQLLGSEIVSGIDRLDAEVDNVLTAVKWALENAEGEVALKILVSLRRYIDVRAFLVKQVRDLIHTALDLTQSSHKSLQARGYASAGRFAWLDRDLENAKKLNQKSLELAKDLNDKELCVRPLISLGGIGVLRWDFDYALEMLEKALNLAKEIGNKRFICHSLLYIAICKTSSEQLSLLENALAFAQEINDEFLKGLILNEMGGQLMSSGKLDIAKDVLNRSLVVWRRLDDKFRQGTVLHNLAFIAIRHCQYEKAKDFFEESLDLNLDGGHSKGIAFATSWLGWIEGMIDSNELAKKSFDEGLRSYQKLKWEPGIAMNLALSADIARIYEDYERADKYCQESLMLYRKFNARSSEFYVLALMACIDLHKGDYSRAWSSYQEALSYIQDGDREDVLDVLEGIAATAVELGLPDFSTQLLAVADQQRATTGILVPLSKKDIYDQAMASAKAALGEEQFTEAWAKGRVMSLDEAISFVQMEIGQNSVSKS